MLENCVNFLHSLNFCKKSVSLKLLKTVIQDDPYKFLDCNLIYDIKMANHAVVLEKIVKTQPKMPPRLGGGVAELFSPGRP